MKTVLTKGEAACLLFFAYGIWGEWKAADLAALVAGEMLAVTLAPSSARNMTGIDVTVLGRDQATYEFAAWQKRNERASAKANGATEPPPAMAESRPPVGAQARRA